MKSTFNALLAIPIALFVFIEIQACTGRSSMTGSNKTTKASDTLEGRFDASAAGGAGGSKANGFDAGSAAGGGGTAPNGFDNGGAGPGSTGLGGPNDPNAAGAGGGYKPLAPTADALFEIARRYTSTDYQPLFDEVKARGLNPNSVITDFDTIELCKWDILRRNPGCYGLLLTCYNTWVANGGKIAANHEKCFCFEVNNEGELAGKINQGCMAAP